MLNWQVNLVECLVRIRYETMKLADLHTASSGGKHLVKTGFLPPPFGLINYRYYNFLPHRQVTRIPIIIHASVKCTYASNRAPPPLRQRFGRVG
jgi:hypothetical protein